MVFPLSPAPSGYKVLTFPSNYAGVFYIGQTPTITLSVTGACTYEVKNYIGTTVSSGNVGSGVLTFTPTAPVGGWLPGWYRVYLRTLGADDSVFGPSLGATNFCFIKDDSHFPTMPQSDVSRGISLRDLPTKGVMGIGTSRLGIGNAAAPTTGSETITDVLADLPNAKIYWSAPSAPYVDPNRSRYLWTNFPNGTCDSVDILSGPFITCARIYCATSAIDGTNVFVAISAGSVSGVKLTVGVPNSGTIVETYDNYASVLPLSVAVNAASTRIKMFTIRDDVPLVTTATAIGRSLYNGVASVVSSLYPDVKYFEGPLNEPTLSAECAHEMYLFNAAVKAGNSNAIVMGPCPVDISNLTQWRSFLAAGGGSYCDVISFHDYNSMTLGSIPQGRNAIKQFKDLLAEFGLSAKPLWQTEAGAAFTAVYGIHHPRRARVKAVHTLLWEQYGVPREQNTYWYDLSHGFWSYPTWFENTDGSLTPDAVIARVLAEETWGKPYASAVDFGTVGNNVLLGNRYTNGTTGETVLVLIATSYMPGLTATFSSETSVTTVDGMGVVTVHEPVNGTITCTLSDIPTYIRGNATLLRISDWPLFSSMNRWISASGQAYNTLDGDPKAKIADTTWPTYYDGTYNHVVRAQNAPPNSVIFKYDTVTRFDRVIIWAGCAWQGYSTLTDFDVDVSADGITWSTVATRTLTPSSFKFGTTYHNIGCERETFWDEQWVFDIKLIVPVRSKYVRIYVRGVSFGGEPDAACMVVGGQGDANPRLVIQEIMLLCDANTIRTPITSEG